jgi:predicted PurR-regulated permease PerM
MLLILSLTGVIIFALVQLKLIVIPVILAIILASALSPLVTLMERIRINRAGGSFIAVFTFIALIASMGYFIVTSIKSQWASNASSVQAGIEQASKWLHSGDLPIPTEKIDELLNAGTKYLSSASFGQSALQFSGGLASLLAGFFLTLVILFFLLKDGDKIFSFFVGFMKESVRDKVHEAGEQATKVLGGYIVGTTMVALIDAVLIGAGLIIMGVPLVVPLCLLVVIGAYIPYLGSVSSSVIISLVALVTCGLHTAIIVTIIVLTVNQVEGLISPIILGNVLKMSALAILLALSVGAIVGGIVGTLLAVPVVAVVWVAWTTWNPHHIQEPAEPIIPEDEDSEPETEELP